MQNNRITSAQADYFIQQILGIFADSLTTISRGEWSQTFAFRQAGRERILRFGQYSEDYRKDQFAVRFRTPQLPIPEVLQIGKAFGGYFAVSEKLPGVHIDDLNGTQIRRAVPAVLNLLDAMRNAELSGTEGYGSWGADGSAKFDSWAEYMLDIANDDHNPRFSGWREKLAVSSLCSIRLDRLVEQMADLLQYAPMDRWLIHSDLLHYNLLMENDKVSGLIDWGCAKYGDFLYDLAWFTFWAPWHQAMRGIDWRVLALEHYAQIGLDVPHFDQRLKACELHIGLDSVIYCAHTGRWEQAEKVLLQMEGISSADG